jgi:hypothetical protein
MLKQCYRPTTILEYHIIHFKVYLVTHIELHSSCLFHVTFLNISNSKIFKIHSQHRPALREEDLYLVHNTEHVSGESGRRGQARLAGEGNAMW